MGFGSARTQLGHGLCWRAYTDRTRSKTAATGNRKLGIHPAAFSESPISILGGRAHKDGYFKKKTKKQGTAIITMTAITVTDDPQNAVRHVFPGGGASNHDGHLEVSICCRRGAFTKLTRAKCENQAWALTWGYV